MQLRVLRYVRLDEHGAALRVEAGGEPVDHHFQRVLLDLGGIGIIGGEGMPVGDKEKTIVRLLQLHPIG